MPESLTPQVDPHPTPHLLKDGKPLGLEELKKVLAPLHPDELLRGLRLDQDNRWHLGEPVRLETYFQAFPILTYDPDRMLVLIYGEVMLRLHLGQEPELPDYQKRFPELAERLGMLFHLQQPPPGVSGPSLLSVTGLTDPLHEVHGGKLHPTVPGYDIEGELGRGGMGVVYKARQNSLNRIVALKMIVSGGYARPQQLAVLRREAELAARLQHPNIVQIFEVGAHAGLAFIAMEYVPGGPLGYKIGGQPQDPRWAAQLVETLAVAAHEAHRKDIIHRDLKPGNILLSIEQVPKIVDFGLAHVMEADSHLSSAGAHMGTPCYMAPEQAEGRGADIGPRTDVYALGAILYELLTGQPPFRGSSAWETMTQVRTLNPVPPSRSQPRLPRDLETICLKALEKDPARRYAGAAELADDLRRFREDQPIRARPAGALERAWRWSRRNRGWAAMFASSIVFLSVLALGAVFSNRQLQRELAKTLKEKNRAEKAESDVIQENAKVVQAKRIAQEQAWETLSAHAESVRLGQGPGRRVASLNLLTRAVRLGRELQLPDEKMARLQDQAIATLAGSDLYPIQTWPGFPPGTAAVDFDETLTIYARLDNHGRCTIRKVADDGELCEIQAPKDEGTAGSDAFPVLSPDGSLLALRHANGRLHLYRLKNWQPRLVFSEDDVYRVDFGPQGKDVVLGHRSGQVSWHDTDTGKLKNKFRVKGFVDPCCARHPTEPLVAVCSAKQGEAEVRDLRTGVRVGSLPSAAPFADVAWLPDGRTLAASIAQNIVLYERAADYLPVRRLITDFQPSILAFSPDGGLLVARAWNHEVHLIKVATGQTLIKLPPGTIPMARLRFSRDGARLAALAQGRDLAIMQVVDGRELRLLASSGAAPYYGASVSPKLPGLTAAGMAGGLAFWDLHNGQEIAFVKTDDLSPIVRVAFAGSGHLLTTGPWGTARWPVQQENARIRVGPPTMISDRPASDVAVSADGHVIATCGRGLTKSQQAQMGVQVFQNGAGPTPAILDKEVGFRYVAVSPNGRWVAAGHETQNKVKIWDLTSKLAATEISGEGSVPSFSPDGLWLAVSGERGNLYEVGTWKPGLIFSGLSAFSPDSTTLGVATAPGVIDLLSLPSGKKVARLQDPRPAAAERLLFSPDGSRVLAISNGATAGIRVWDLPLLRRGLAEFGLDGDIPHWPNPASAPLPPLEIDEG